MVDKNTHRSRGFGFVTFMDEDTVERVMEKKNDHQINGKWIDCKKALPVNHEVLQKAKKDKQKSTKKNQEGKKEPEKPSQDEESKKTNKSFDSVGSNKHGNDNQKQSS